MTETSHTQWMGSVPEHYDRYLGPLFFEPFAADIVKRVEKLGPTSVLELAAGTGIVTRHLSEVLPPEGHVLATDLNQAMLDYATPKFELDNKVKLEQMDAINLTLPQNAFDLVVCQFGWMLFPDKLAAAKESHRVLLPDGHLLFSVWDSIDKNPGSRIVRETIASFFVGDPPPFYLAPFSYYDVDEIKKMLEEAGFERITIDNVSMICEVPSAREVAPGFVRGNPVIFTLEERATADIDTIVEAVAEALVRELGDKPMRVPLQALVVHARPAV